MGLILFFWILGGTGLIALWADRIFSRSDSSHLFRLDGQRLRP